MSERKRILSLVLIMAAVSFLLVGISLYFLYNTGLEEGRERLLETVQSQARLIEAVARFDALHAKGYPEGPETATLSQVIDAHKHYKGFGKTGEFTLARLEQDNIVFLLSHRHFDLDHPKPVPFESKIAEPMRRALLGQSGTMVGLDYRGETVLAAYEPVSELNLGTVAKIDLAEVQAPFKKAVVMTLGYSVLVILGGTSLFFRISNPIIKRLEKHSTELQGTIDKITQEVNERVRIEEDLKWELSVSSSLAEMYELLTSPSSSIEETAKMILGKGKILTNSKHGYVSSIDPLTGNSLGHTLTEMMKDQCTVTDDKRQFVFPKAEDGTYHGLWGHALNTGEAFFSNSPEEHEASAGVPEGHIRLERFLSIPVMLEKDLVGQIALANKDEAYTDRDLDAIRRLGEYYALAIMRKRAEEALLKERENFVNILNAIEDGVYVVNQQYDIEYINPPLMKEFGQVAGRKCYQYFHERKEPCPWCKNNDVFAGNTVRWEWYSSKNLKTYDLIDTPLRNLDGSTSKLEIFRDITDIKRAQEVLRMARKDLEDRVEERTAKLIKSTALLEQEIEQRKQVEEQLQKSRGMLQRVFDGISDPLLLLGEDLSVKMLNESGVEYYGITELQEVLGKPCHMAFQGKSDPCEGCQIPSAVIKHHKTTFERQGLKDPRSLEKVVVYPLQKKNGEPGDILLRINDITERKLFEKQLIQSEKMAALGMLVSGITHEINNPNAFISFNIPILREYVEELIHIADNDAAAHPDLELFHMPYPEFRKDILGLIDNLEHGSRRINSFVSNLREFSRIRYAGRRNWVDLHSVIEKAVSICRSKINKTVKSLHIDIPKDFPQIYTDPYSLEHVLVNLLINAAQAVDKEDSWVKLRAVAGDSWQDKTIIEVQDNGCGIDEEEIKHVFEPFFSTKTPREGTGLGLYVCHELIMGLQGRFEVEALVGEFSTFRVILPDKERRSQDRA